jgi:single-strand DNA-binding protein
MAASLNRVFLMGNLTRDPELRYVPSGTAVASFTIAVNRVYNSAAGERKEETCFVRVVVWGRRAEVCGEYLSKGNPVFVEGRLRTRSWETPDGQKRNAVEVVANNIQFLRSSKGAPPQETAMENQAMPEDVTKGQGVKDVAGDRVNGESPLPNDEVPF